MKFIAKTILVMWVTIFFIYHCSNNNSSNSIELFPFSKSESIVLENNDVNQIIITNNNGSINVTGWSIDNSIRLNLYKSIEAHFIDSTELYFDNIVAEVINTNNTIEIIINPPANTEYIEYKSTSVSIEIPYNMNCKINKATGSIFIDQLDSDLDITGLTDLIQISRHQGSCNVKSEGDINVVTNFAFGNSCQLTTSEGDVVLKIPDTTQCSVYILTQYGAISYGGLSFDQLNRTSNLFEGVIGNGTNSININSKNGNITLIGI